MSKHMASVLLACLLINLSVVKAQILDGPEMENNGLCDSFECQTLKEMPKMAKCIVIVGNLIVNLENSTAHDFENFSFPNLREEIVPGMEHWIKIGEPYAQQWMQKRGLTDRQAICPSRNVTGYVAVYRVIGLRSLGQLFPNLALIRGQQLIRNYALGVHTLPDLNELGLYNLLRVEHGGVMIWNCPKACFVETVNWDTIAPRGRQIIAKSNYFCEGLEACRCMNYPDVDYCWNRKKCQRLLTGPVAEVCHDQCLGCRKTDLNRCTRCRYYTDNHGCVPRCPENKVVLPQTLHCLTREECYKLFDGKGWVSNKTCMESCPKGYEFIPLKNSIDNGTCEKCNDCVEHKVCNGYRKEVKITSLTDAYKYSHCVVINGSLVIKLHSSKYSMEDLRNLKGIVEIKDYLMISSSVGITSLDFLESLKLIKGDRLWENKYSIVIREMKNLRTLFPEKQAKELKINKGTILAYNNPQLCMTEIENFHMYMKWPMGHRAHISSTSNGYFGECQNINIPLNVTAVGERSAWATFRHIHPERNGNVTFDYSLHYVEVFPDFDIKRVPFYCGDRPWKTIEVDSSDADWEIFNIKNLQPTTTYALYVEASHTSASMVQNENLTDYGISNVKNFSTVVGLPPPPFIVEIAALSPYSFALNWIDHLNHAPHIKRYLLDVSIINYDKRKIESKNQCLESFTLTERKIEDRFHVTVRSPPADYGEICICGKSLHFRRDKSCIFKPWRSSPTFDSLSPVINKEHFDVCDSFGINCDDAWEHTLLQNITIGGVIQSLGVELSAPRNQYVVRELLPFHDYKLRLRACTGPSEDTCGRSARERIRTQMIRDNDVVRLRKATLKDTEFTLIWDPPETPNGYVLAFFVQMKHLVIYEVCITPVEHETNHRTYYYEHKNPLEEYSVRVCTSSMAADRVCSPWISKLAQGQFNWLSVVLPVVIVIFIVIVIAVRWWRNRMASEDRAHLLENFELMPIQSEPPAACEDT